MHRGSDSTRYLSFRSPTEINWMTHVLKVKHIKSCWIGTKNNSHWNLQSNLLLWYNWSMGFSESVWKQEWDQAVMHCLQLLQLSRRAGTKRQWNRTVRQGKAKLILIDPVQVCLWPPPVQLGSSLFCQLKYCQQIRALSWILWLIGKAVSASGGLLGGA